MANEILCPMEAVHSSSRVDQDPSYERIQYDLFKRIAGDSITSAWQLCTVGTPYNWKYRVSGHHVDEAVYRDCFCIEINKLLRPCCLGDEIIGSTLGCRRILHGSLKLQEHYFTLQHCCEGFNTKVDGLIISLSRIIDVFCRTDNQLLDSLLETDRRSHLWSEYYVPNEGVFVVECTCALYGYVIVLPYPSQERGCSPTKPEFLESEVLLYPSY